MGRIVYVGFPTGAVAGGQKMIIRHVETLRELGFDAVYWRHPENRMPTWFDHKAPVEVGTVVPADDIVVMPEDAPNALARAAEAAHRVLIFCQSHLNLMAHSAEALARFPAERFPTFIAPGPGTAAGLRRIFPEAQVEVVRCFADERVFRPRPDRAPGIVCIPRKRPLELRAIRALFSRRYPRHAGLPWVELEGASEAEVARSLGGASLFLSLSRMEAVGMTPLEAMAAGCVCAGFTGGGGRDFATPENGFWVDEDDWEGATEALACAADLVLQGGPDLERHLAAAQATADAWSYRAFRDELEQAWTKLAPQARRL